MGQSASPDKATTPQQLLKQAALHRDCAECAVQVWTTLCGADLDNMKAKHLHSGRGETSEAASLQDFKLLHLVQAQYKGPSYDMLHALH